MVCLQVWVWGWLLSPREKSPVLVYCWVGGSVEQWTECKFRHWTGLGLSQFRHPAFGESTAHCILTLLFVACGSKRFHLCYPWSWIRGLNFHIFLKPVGFKIRILPLSLPSKHVQQESSLGSKCVVKLISRCHFPGAYWEGGTVGKRQKHLGVRSWGCICFRRDCESEWGPHILLFLALHSQQGSRGQRGNTPPPGAPLMWGRQRHRITEIHTEVAGWQGINISFYFFFYWSVVDLQFVLVSSV